MYYEICANGKLEKLSGRERRSGFFKTLPPNRLPPLPSSRFYEITTNSAMFSFSSPPFFLLVLSGVIVELIGRK